MKRAKCGVAILLVLAALVWAAEAAAPSAAVSSRPWASNVIVPQSRAFSTDRQPAVQITGVEVGVVILEQAATTTMDISLQNTSGSRQEAELLVPVPDGAAVRSFTFQGSSSEPTAQVLPKDEARRTYDSIVRQIRDPALLEFAGYNLIRSSVFPIDPRGSQKVRLTYEHLLPADGTRVDYVLPRSESLDYKVPWHVTVRFQSSRPVSTVYSPSHRLETVRAARGVVSARIAENAVAEPGAFRLSYLLANEGVTASLLAYPDPRVGGGYFLMLAGLPIQPAEGGRNTIRRELTLVLDHSGSMSGEKIRQVIEAAIQILGGLAEGEAFNIIVYNDTVDRFSDRPVVRSRETLERATAFLRGVQARGGTNIHDALLEALRQRPTPGMLPVVLFLTDGLPTVGQTSEIAIRDVAIQANPHERRIFTFGVGVDVNAPLLDRLALETRGTSTYVLPKEDVEVKVGQIYKRLTGPVLANAKLQVLGADNAPAMSRVRDILPAKLPDLFEGDQLVLLGQYVGDQPLTFEVSGNYLGQDRAFRFRFTLDKATTRNAFVPRLWASRKIGFLGDAIRQLGANGSPQTSHVPPPSDPRVKELVDEIVRLSTEFGILTEYTAFLAREGTNLAQRDEVRQQAQRNFENRAMAQRTGNAGVAQSVNNDFQQRQKVANFANAYVNDNMERVTIGNVQQVNDRAFYQRGNRWVDSRLVEQEDKVKPQRVVEFGSDEFLVLVHRLADEGRQGSIAFAGDVLLVVDGQPVLVRNSAAAQPPADASK